MMKFVTDIKMSASYLLDLSGGCDHHEETTSPRLYSSSLLLFSGNTIIKKTVPQATGSKI
jgi:hypothetical protein